MKNLKEWIYAGEFLTNDQLTYGKKYHHPEFHRNIFIGVNTKIMQPEKHFVQIEASDYSIKPIIQKWFHSEKEAYNFAYDFMKKFRGD